MMQYQYTIHNEKKVYDGFFQIHRYQLSFEKFAGNYIENVYRECGRKGDIVGVLPYDPVRQVFLMVEQFRIGMAIRQEHPWTLEIVAGFMDVPNESPVQTAMRELTEETGCCALDVYPLIDYYPSSGGSAAKNYVFIMTVDAETALEHTGLTEEGEDIRVHHIPLKVMQDKLVKGEIDNATAIIALQYFFMQQWQDKLSVVR
ncbi:MAG: NUDIX domain-containing protein [Ostreibacterium sp.]